MEYIEISDGIVKGHYSAKTVPEGNQYKKVSKFTGVIGTPVEQLKATGELFSKEELIREGILIPKERESLIWEKNEWKIKSDYRNSSYWLKATGKKVLFLLGQLPDDTMTDIEPPHPSAIWDEDCWDLSEETIIEDLRFQRTTEFSLFDKYQLPLLWNDLSEEHKEEYIKWRKDWLMVTETKTKPERPLWFN